MAAVESPQQLFLATDKFQTCHQSLNLHHRIHHLQKIKHCVSHVIGSSIQPKLTTALVQLTVECAYIQVHIHIEIPEILIEVFGAIMLALTRAVIKRAIRSSNVTLLLKLLN